MKGYREFIRACSQAEKETQGVRARARSGLSVTSSRSTRSSAPPSASAPPRSALGYKTYVRQTGVVVGQSLKKTTGLKPWWGGIQMNRSFLPALAANEDRVEREFEKAIDLVCDHFEQAP